jgi:hypothetical protein
VALVDAESETEPPMTVADQLQQAEQQVLEAFMGQHYLQGTRFGQKALPLFLIVRH